ncbi:MAG: conjugal transfer protein TraB, partial [Nitrospirae bacterium]
EKPKEKIPASEKEKIPGLPPLPEPKPKEKITALPPPPPPVYQPPKETTQKVTLVGGIETVEVKVEKEKKDVKKNKKTIYLPPSFMEATLLSGLDAPTSKSGRRSSIPALFRIKTPAVLPNKVKARLKGCFVIAEGRGELSTERVEMRLVSLSCIDRKGNAVIDQHIKGFVIDEDGKIGLKGYVVAKFGSMIARSMLAGFIEGIGQSTEQAFKDISISPEGVVTSTDKTKDVIGSGIGGGIAGASGATKDFFVELARETYPILEVGNSKPVTIVISEGVELEVKPMKKIGGLEL